MNLKKSLFLLPNVITLASIFCGFDAIRVSAEARDDNDYWRACLLIIFAVFFDTMDGRVARATKTQSAFGLQIDSLADVVSFGVAPALLVYDWSLRQLGDLGIVGAFVFLACGAIRLARFNVLATREGMLKETLAREGRDRGAQASKPGKYIVGLPIPGGAGIVISMIVANHAVHGDLSAPRYAMMVLAVVSTVSALMVSTVKFRSFKDLKLNARSVAFVAAVVASSAVISASYSPAFVVVWLIGGYVTIGLFETVIGLPRAIARRRERGVGAVGARGRMPQRRM